MLIRKILIILIALIAVIVWVSKAKALTITEYMVELNANPGDSFERKMNLYDDTKQGATVYVSTANFAEDPSKEGYPLIIAYPAEFKPDKEWIKLERDQLEIPNTGEMVSFIYKIEVPNNAEPGTHMISIVFETRPPAAKAEGTTVSLSSRLVDNIFLRVGGATIDSLEAEFKTGQYTNNNPTIPIAERHKSFKEKHFFFKPPVDFLVRVINKGNTHQKPGGNIRIQNDLFSRAYEKLPINLENYIVLPGAGRGFEVDSFGQGFMFGKYRAKLTLIYGNPLKEYTKEVVFWIIPLKEILIALGILLLIAIVIIVIVIIQKKRRRVKERGKEEKLRMTLREEIEMKLKESKEKDRETRSDQNQS